MSIELAPERVLRHYLREPDPLVPSGPWRVRWDLVPDREAMLRSEVPDTVVVRTSGATGTPGEWSRSREKLLDEAALLAGLWHDSPVDLTLAFAPPPHLYGLLTTLVLPAVLGVPVHYQPGLDALSADVAGRVVGVTAIPWTFRILQRDQELLSAAAEITIMHSTATLPPGADEVAAGLGARVIEVFGSTESGGIAHRQGREGPWTLFDDVTLVEEETGEVPLVVSGPRLAAGLTTWCTDDFVEVVDERHFRFHGRRTRLRKINGVRVDLDDVDHRLRAAVPCADLACVAVDDPVRGESFTVLVVPDASEPPSLPTSVRVALKAWGLAPHDVLIVSSIERSEMGKLRR
ncbi:long-chain fatty acid--CoA ligase [Kibdelosporangium philippinense]|uniref:Long-chain fatty acid--CoA ligase n=1 Tax=Kibdelosporangium philippinense TaxID=211113 RepID=A0ABS8Z5F4_9PSEU|nr:long-chain fatty acid--CoA ligase [Kibdelosporangium philippinense]MCE7002244.1 long-chain fatty acid--CoA ligase [Kibdelosporangium philippinense]